jgi:large subunit ribosomal protein L37Ae
MVVGYGKKLRVKLAEVKKKSNKLYKCPSCSRVSVRREANGVWKCKKCGVKYASGAFEFKE